ncbi:MAG: hypothetical protein MZU97_00715 [Bacillus subtilis]|nr:hypothetical protein [Bacillus subtilis]
MIDIHKTTIKTTNLKPPCWRASNGTVNIVIVEEPKRRDQGDLSIPAFVVGKALRTWRFPKWPKRLREELAVTTLSRRSSQRSNIFGGFVNLFLDKKAIAQKANRRPSTIDESVYARRFACQRQNRLHRLFVARTSPNRSPSGILRSTIIGQAIGNLLAKLRPSCRPHQPSR